LRVISCEKRDNQSSLFLATKVTGAVPISAADVGAEVRLFPVHNRAVPVYDTLDAAIVPPPVAFNAELCKVTVNAFPTISDTVNL
jgi:hypothetical protein